MTELVYAVVPVLAFADLVTKTSTILTSEAGVGGGVASIHHKSSTSSFIAAVAYSPNGP